MNDYGYARAQDRYDRQLPERYDEEPVFHCKCCGEDIFVGEICHRIGESDIFCNFCHSEIIAGREEI